MAIIHSTIQGIHPCSCSIPAFCFISCPCSCPIPAFCCPPKSSVTPLSATLPLSHPSPMLLLYSCLLIHLLSEIRGIEQRLPSIVKPHRQADSSDLRFCDRRIANKPIRDACAALFPASRTAHAQESKKRAKRAASLRPPPVFVSYDEWIAARFRFLWRMDCRPLSYRAANGFAELLATATPYVEWQATLAAL